MRIQYPHSSLVALSAAYILLPTAESDIDLCVTDRTGCDKPHVLQKGLKSIAHGSLVMAISLIFLGYPRLGLGIGVAGGGTLLAASLAVTFGLLKWTEDHLDALGRSQREKLGRVLEKYGIDPAQSEELERLVHGEIEELHFETFHGVLSTKRADKGYVVTLGGKEDRQAELVKGADTGGEWQRVVRTMVDEEWSQLVDLYD